MHYATTCILLFLFLYSPFFLWGTAYAGFHFSPVLGVVLGQWWSRGFVTGTDICSFLVNLDARLFRFHVALSCSGAVVYFSCSFSPMIMNHDVGFQCLQPYAAAWTALI